MSTGRQCRTALRDAATVLGMCLVLTVPGCGSPPPRLPAVEVWAHDVLGLSDPAARCASERLARLGLDEEEADLLVGDGIGSVPAERRHAVVGAVVTCAVATPRELGR